LRLSSSALELESEEEDDDDDAEDALLPVLREVIVVNVELDEV